MFLKIIAGIALVVGILFVALVSDAVVARTWLMSEKATAAMHDPSCVIVGQPWPEWKWANTPWLSPPCDDGRNAPPSGSAKAEQKDARSPAQESAKESAQDSAANSVRDIKPEFKADETK